jgi:hypothetical protein
MRNDVLLMGKAAAAESTADMDHKFASLVNYATAPLGAKKYDASTLSR